MFWQLPIPQLKVYLFIVYRVFKKKTQKYTPPPLKKERKENQNKNMYSKYITLMHFFLGWCEVMWFCGPISSNIDRGQKEVLLTELARSYLLSVLSINTTWHRILGWYNIIWFRWLVWEKNHSQYSSGCWASYFTQK